MQKKPVILLYLMIGLFLGGLSGFAAKLPYDNSEKPWLLWGLAGVVYLWSFGWGLHLLRRSPKQPLSFLPALLFLITFFGFGWFALSDWKKTLYGLADDQITHTLRLAYLDAAAHQALCFAVLFGLFGLAVAVLLLGRQTAPQEGTLEPLKSPQEQTSSGWAWSLDLGIGGMVMLAVGGWFVAIGQQQCYTALSKAMPDQVSLLRAMLKSGLSAYHIGSQAMWLGGALAVLGFALSLSNTTKRRAAYGGLLFIAVLFTTSGLQKQRWLDIWQTTNADGASLRHLPTLQLPTISLDPAPSQGEPKGSPAPFYARSKLWNAEPLPTRETDWEILDATEKTHSLKPPPPPTPIVETPIANRFARYVAPPQPTPKPAPLPHTPETSALMLPCELWSSRERLWRMQRFNPSIRYNGSCCTKPKQQARLALDRRLSWATVLPRLTKHTQKSQCAFSIAGISPTKDANAARFPWWLFGRPSAHAFALFAWPAKQEIPSWKGGSWLHLHRSPTSLLEGQTPLSASQAFNRVGAWRKQCGKRCGIKLSADPQTSWQELLQTYLSLHQAWANAPYVPGPLLLSL